MHDLHDDVTCVVVEKFSDNVFHFIPDISQTREDIKKTFQRYHPETLINVIFQFKENPSLYPAQFSSENLPVKSFGSKSAVQAISV